MGAYLAKASTEKDTTSGGSASGAYSYAHSSMQGWRMNMEDDYTCCPNLNLLKNLGIYAVFDGHGGPEVAEYVAQILPEKVASQMTLEIINLINEQHKKLAKINKDCKKGKMSDSRKSSNLKSDTHYSPDLEYIKLLASLLNKVILEIDASITTQEIAKKLKTIAVKHEKGSDASSDISKAEREERAEELQDLLDESELSVEQLMEKYGYENMRAADSGGQAGSSSKKTSKDPAPARKTEKLTTAFDDDGDWEDDDDDDDNNDGNDNGDDGSDSNDEDVQLDAEETPSEPEDEIDSNYETKTKLEGASEMAETQLSEDQDEPTQTNKNTNLNKDSNSTSESETLDDQENESKKPNKEKNTEISNSKLKSESLFRQKMVEVFGDDLELEDKFASSGYFYSDGPDDVDEISDPNNIYDKKQSRGVESGTTAVISFLTDSGLLVVANVGDSRALVGRVEEPEDEEIKDDKDLNEPDKIDSKKYIAIDMSVDHKPEDEIELNRITKAGGHISMDGRVDGGLNLSRCLGDHLYKQTLNLSLSEQKISPKPDIRFYQLTSADKFIVLACDGIWNCMSSQKVAEFVGNRIDSGQALTKITEELLDECVAPDTKGDGTGCDNMTVIIINIEDEFRKRASTLKFNSDRDSVVRLVHVTDEHDIDQMHPSNHGLHGHGMSGFEESRFMEASSKNGQGPFNVNLSDGSSQLAGKLLDEDSYKQVDFEFNEDTKLWTAIPDPDQNKENKCVAVINNINGAGKAKLESNGATEITDSPPSKKPRKV